MKSFEKDLIFHQGITIQIGGSLRLLGEYRGKQDLYRKQSPHILETLKQVAMVQSTESSSRIEGVTAEPERLKAIIADKTTPRDRSEAEIAGYRDALARVHANHESIEVSPETILHMHSQLFRYTERPSGTWKKQDNFIEERLPDGSWRTRFVPVSAELTPHYIEELCKKLKSFWHEERIDPMLLIPSFILDFLCIHPFTDGNGRISRLLTLLLLYHAGYGVGRYIGLERIIEQSKETYYEVLLKSSKGWHEGKHTLLPWWSYFLGTLISAYKEFEQRVGFIATSRGAKSKMVLQAINQLPERFSIGQLESACPDVSRPLIRIVLNKIKREGKIKCVKGGRDARWQKM